MEFARVPYDHERLDDGSRHQTDLITTFQAPPAAAGAGH